MQIAQKPEIFISTFSGRVQLTTLSISNQFMRMTWVKLLKMSLRNVEKEINSKEDYYTVGEIRNPSKNVIYPKFVPKFSRNLSPIIFF